MMFPKTERETLQMLADAVDVMLDNMADCDAHWNEDDDCEYDDYRHLRVAWRIARRRLHPEAGYRPGSLLRACGEVTP